MEEREDDLLPDRLPELLEEGMPLAAVLDERVLLRERAEVNALAEVVHRLQVLAPALVDDLEDHVALDVAGELGGELLLPLGVRLERVVDELVGERLAALHVCLLVQLVDRDVAPVEGLHARDEPLEIPVLRELGVGELGDDRRDRLLDPATDLVREVHALEHLPTLLVDDHALRVHHVVVLEDVLARDEVLLLDLLLRVLDLLGEDPRLHGLIVRDLEAGHDVLDPVAREQADEVVLPREVEARLAGVALAPGAAAELVVDPPRLVALRAEHVQAAEIEDAFPELDVDAAARPCSSRSSPRRAGRRP